MSVLADTHAVPSLNYDKYNRYTKRAASLFTFAVIGAIILGVFAVLYHLEVLSSSTHDPDYANLVANGWYCFAGSMSCTFAALIALGFFVYNYGEKMRCQGARSARQNVNGEL